MAGACPFCDYAGPSPVLEDYGDVFVIEPLNPVTPGHVLVVPHLHADDATADLILAGRAMEIAGLWARDRAGGPCNIITSVGAEATQTVRHLHLHVIPRRACDGLALPWSPRG